MIGHEAVAPYFCPGTQGGFAEQINVQRVVALLKEDASSPITPLLNMVGVTRGNNSR